MADNDARKSYPKIPAKNWWDLRRRFQQSPPKAVDADYLMTVLGLSSQGAAANVLAPLKTVGLISEDGTPTARAHDWRDDDSYPKVCRSILQDVYPAVLLDLFPPPDPDPVGLKSWFARNAGVGSAAASQMAAFYRLLSEADPKGFDRAPQRRSPGTSGKRDPGARPAAKARAEESAKAPASSAFGSVPIAPAVPASASPSSTSLALGPVGGITVNIELQIPATADAKFFDQFFSSMRKHLLDEHE